MNAEMLLKQLKNISKLDESKYQQTKDILREHGIEVKSTGGANLGRCYNSNTFEISSSEELSDEVINILWNVGVIGYGQEFSFKKEIQRDGMFVVTTESRVDSSD